MRTSFPPGSGTPGPALLVKEPSSSPQPPAHSPGKFSMSQPSAHRVSFRVPSAVSNRGTQQKFGRPQHPAMLSFGLSVATPELPNTSTENPTPTSPPTGHFLPTIHMGLVPRNPCMDTVGTQYPHVLCPHATNHQESQSLSTQGLHTDRVLPRPTYPNSRCSHTAHTPTPLGNCALSPRRPMLPGSPRYRSCVPVTPIQRPSPNNPARGHSHHSPQQCQHFPSIAYPNST